jgi:hypothetical protein
MSGRQPGEDAVRPHAPADDREQEDDVAFDGLWAGGEDGALDADGFVVLVADPVTGHCDCYGPYGEADRARGEAEWRRLEFDLADLPDVVIGVVPWHADHARLTDTEA